MTDLASFMKKKKPAGQDNVKSSTLAGMGAANVGSVAKIGSAAPKPSGNNRVSQMPMKRRKLNPFSL